MEAIYLSKTLTQKTAQHQSPEDHNCLNSFIIFCTDLGAEVECLTQGATSIKVVDRMDCQNVWICEVLNIENLPCSCMVVHRENVDMLMIAVHVEFYLFSRRRNCVKFCLLCQTVWSLAGNQTVKLVWRTCNCCFYCFWAVLCSALIRRLSLTELNNWMYQSNMPLLIASSR